MCPCRPQRDPGVKEPPSPRSPPPNIYTLAIDPPQSPEVRHVPAKALVSVGQCRELDVCFLGIDSGPALPVVVEMCMCSPLSSSPKPCAAWRPRAQSQEPAGRTGWTRSQPAPTPGPGIPPGTLGRKTLTGAAGGLREAPQGLCSAGPPRCSSGLHVPGSVARALLWDCPVAAIGQGRVPGMWARNGGSALGGSEYGRRPSSWREATRGALRKGDCGETEGRRVGCSGGTFLRTLGGGPGPVGSGGR